ncbi:serine/threonine-protein phosphatase 2b catalytic subunit 1-related [Anaeramoeba flamelloides]|uniref:Serine/threonine-protein phosphatase 2b catalytic subunit 1-related n=1 Tax=Anaeramoeba flamelloides TaxID=1746091 RepID=A0AAV7ZN31_9EUKA|nr:serine/threonine-protein phosphatase 2b catalytic subunit 1-related [Anaeramoeba flamelloides]
MSSSDFEPMDIEEASGSDNEKKKEKEQEKGKGKGKEKEKEKVKEQEKKRKIVRCGSDRKISKVIQPTRIILTTEDIFSNSISIPNHQVIKEHFFFEGKIEKKAILKICHLVQEILKKEQNLIYVQSPVIIFGDLHGKFYDLCNQIQKCGECENNKNHYLFLGDYVDRGNFGFEIVCYLFALKIALPKACFLLRGNSECRQVTSFFNFKSEVVEKYDVEIYNEIMNTFDCLPLAAIVDDKFFCVHGGISPKLKTLESLNRINRFQETPSQGLFPELLWSDPHPHYDKPKKTPYDFTFNTLRNCAYLYSYNAICKFLFSNNLTCVIRAHESQQKGYLMYRKGMQTNFPSLITIFSSPNYVGYDRNKGAVIKYGERAIVLKEFGGVDEPYYLPRRMDVFSWSIPFLKQKIHSYWDEILSLGTKQTDNNSEKPNVQSEKSPKTSLDSILMENKKKRKNPNYFYGNLFLDKNHCKILKLKMLFFSQLFVDYSKAKKLKKNKYNGMKSNKINLHHISRSQSIQPFGVYQKNRISLIDSYTKNLQLKKISIIRSPSLEGHLLKRKLETGIRDCWLATHKDIKPFELKASKKIMDIEKNKLEDIKEIEFETSNIIPQKKDLSKKFPQIIQIERFDGLKKIKKTKKIRKNSRFKNPNKKNKPLIQNNQSKEKSNQRNKRNIKNN